MVPCGQGPHSCQKKRTTTKQLLHVTEKSLLQVWLDPDAHMILPGSHSFQPQDICIRCPLCWMAQPQIFPWLTPCHPGLS